MCDEMLGSLAKWLRILGYDTKYVRDMKDDEISKISLDEGRILITRDKLLHKKTPNSIYVENNGLEEQIKKIFKEKNLKIDENKFLTRCIVCNEKIIEIEKEKVKEKVPEHIYAIQDKFYICPKCRKIYWKGSHWENMKEFIKKLQNNKN